MICLPHTALQYFSVVPSLHIRRRITILLFIPHEYSMFIHNSQIFITTWMTHRTLNLLDLCSNSDYDCDHYGEGLQRLCGRSYCQQTAEDSIYPVCGHSGQCSETSGGAPFLSGSGRTRRVWGQEGAETESWFWDQVRSSPGGVHGLPRDRTSTPGDRQRQGPGVCSHCWPHLPISVQLQNRYTQLCRVTVGYL